jgi:hypothetical protein
VVTAQLERANQEGTHAFALELTSSASPERLFRLLSDAPGWPKWFGVARRVDWVRLGDDGHEGTVGAVRRVLIGPVGVEEEIVASLDPSHHAYGIKTTIPVQNHRADVWFSEVDGTTRIVWATSFNARNPVIGRLVAVGLRIGVGRLARALTKAAES